ncbi:MAG: lipoprotein signal peptidase [Prevotella sp.]|nr:lipoprotein signal peptidase [Prevotella sp.]MBP3511977.1 lipoprotein signal peptidase [Prevotella sp.]
MRRITDVLTRGRMAMLIVIAILLIDQAIKIWVKTNMTLHETISVTSWFKICFIENNGMAYGMEIGSKVALSIFRIIAIGGIGYYLYLEICRKAKIGYIMCLSLVIAGAVGNVVDCLFYGQIFNASSEYYTSYFVPFGTGYAPFLMGKVVDMFYFPLIVTTWPEWVPWVGGNEFIFFSPIFNFADASISVGFALLILFYRKEISNLTIAFKK